MRVDIVGAGPAGLALAAQLVHDPGSVSQIHVWERNSEVRTTPCGEGVLTQHLSLLPGFDSTPYIGALLEGAALDIPGAPRMFLDAPCATMRREAWLPAIADHLQREGVSFHFDSFLDEEAVRNLPGDVVVGADGPSSRVARIVGAQRQFVPAVQWRIETDPPLAKHLLFVWDPEISKDYAWVFPRGDHVSVGALGPAGPAMRKRLEALNERYDLQGRVVREESYPIPFAGSVVQSGRYCLLGDAAGTANPLTKGGIAPGFHQATVLAAALRSGHPESYGATWDRHPVSSDLPVKAANALHRLRRDEPGRLLGGLPEGWRLTRLDLARVGGRFVALSMRRPGFARDAVLLARALSHGSKWGW